MYSVWNRANPVCHIEDLKGANVLVDNSGVCKLADFGSAKRIQTLIEGDQMHSIKGNDCVLYALACDHG